MSGNNQAPQNLSVLDELLDALRSVEDLDGLHLLAVSNEALDRYSPPLRDWLLELLNTERRRRETGIEPEYPLVDFLAWSPAVLVNTANLSLVIAEAAVIAGNPAIQGFAFRLVQLLVGLVGATLLERAQRQ